jgi:hypothetical protein
MLLDASIVNKKGLTDSKFRREMGDRVETSHGVCVMPRKYVKKGGQGGPRPGAGCKRADNYADNCVIQHYRQGYSILPLDCLLSSLSGIDPFTGEPFTNKNRPSRKQLYQLAMAALPYVHHRLAPVSFEQTRPEPQHALDYRRLTTEELKQLERIIIKGQALVPAEEPKSFAGSLSNSP